MAMPTPPIAEAGHLPPAGFDYTGMPADLAERQRGRAERIGAMKRRTVETMGEIGRELLDAQADLEHGAFLRWVEEAAGMSRSTAYRFMDVSKAFGAELLTVGNLPVDVVQKLARRSTPPALRASVVDRIKAGEDPNPDAILAEMRMPPRARAQSAGPASAALAAPAAAAQEAPAPAAREVAPGTLDEAARRIVEAMGGRGGGVIDALYAAGLDGLAEAITDRLDAGARTWPAMGGTASERSAEMSARGRATADLADLLRQADHVASLLPDVMHEAIRVEAWGDRMTASGQVRKGSTFLDWATSPEGIDGTHPDRIVTALEFAMCAQDNPTAQDRAFDLACHRKPGEARRYAEQAIELFEERAGIVRT